MLSVLRYSDKSMRSPTWAQEQMWKENENKLIQILNKSSSTFKELVDNHELGLSRAVLNQHLKALTKQGIVKKEYKDGKLLNILQTSEISLVDYFLSQLVGLGVPKPIADKGKQLLSQDILMFSAIAHQMLYVDMSKMTLAITKKQPKRIIKGETKELTYSPIPPHVLKLKWNMKGESPGKSEIITELNPYVFHMVISEYATEVGRSDTILKTHLVRQVLDAQPKEYKEMLQRPMDWWLDEVCPYLPLSGFLTIVAAFFNAVKQEYFPHHTFIIKY